MSRALQLYRGSILPDYESALEYLKSDEILNARKDGEIIIARYYTDNEQTAVETVIGVYNTVDGVNQVTVIAKNDGTLKEVYLGDSSDTINTETGEITKNVVSDPQSLNFAYKLGDNNYSMTKINLSKFITTSEIGQGLQVSNSDNVSVKVANGLTVGSNGVSVKASNGLTVDSNGISVNTDNRTITIDNNQIKTNLTIHKLDSEELEDLSDVNVMEAYKLIYATDSSKTAIGDIVKIYKDSSLIDVYLGASTDTINETTGVITKHTVTDPQSMNFAYQLADHTYRLTKIDVSKFLTESEFSDGLEVSGAGVVSVKEGSGITVGGDGVAVQAVPEGVISVNTNGVDVKLGGGLEKQVVTGIGNTIAVKTSSETISLRTIVYDVDTNNVLYIISVSDYNNLDSLTKEYYISAYKEVNGSDIISTSDYEELTDTDKEMYEAVYVLKETITKSEYELIDSQTLKEAYVISQNNYVPTELLSVGSNGVVLDNVRNSINNAVLNVTDVTGFDLVVSSPDDKIHELSYTNTGTYIGQAQTNTIKSDIKALDTAIATITQSVVNGIEAADNSIEVENNNNTYYLYVHIADNSLLVTDNGISVHDVDCGEYGSNITA